MNAIVDRLKSARVAPVIRTSTEALARQVVEILREEGFDLFEITLTTPGAIAIIRDLAADPSLCIGAGTITRAEQGRDVAEAGAGFVVSPAFVPGLAEICSEAGTPLALGAATPSEALRAHEQGAAFVKLFPAAQLGGPGFVKALRSVFPAFTFMPTGGIGPDDIPAYLSAGAACLGMGGNLVNEAALRDGNDHVIRDAARAVQAAIRAL